MQNDVHMYTQIDTQFNIFDLIPNLTMQQIGYPIVTVSCLHDCLIVLAGGTEMI